MTLDLRRRALFGFNFIDAPDLAPVVDALLAGDGADPTIRDAVPLVFTPNVDLLVHLDRNDSPRANALVRRAAFVLADGQPVVWASRLLGAPLEKRLAGSTLVAQLWPRVVTEQRDVLVIAANQHLALLLRADHPKARVVVAPRMRSGDDDALAAFAEECVATCDGVTPELVFVGLSYPNQYVLLDDLMARWSGPEAPQLYLAVGASFEMYYGLRKRSPEWMQRAGLEWFYRWMQEPRRLFRRYFIDDISFGRIVWNEYRAMTAGGQTTPAVEREIGEVVPGPWSASRSDHVDAQRKAN